MSDYIGKRLQRKRFRRRRAHLRVRSRVQGTADRPRLAVSPRRAWVLRLNDGLTIALGRDAANDPIEARLARLVAAYPQTLGRLARKAEHVDARYPNGFALRVPEGKGG